MLTTMFLPYLACNMFRCARCGHHVPAERCRLAGDTQNCQNEAEERSFCLPGQDPEYDSWLLRDCGSPSFDAVYDTPQLYDAESELLSPPLASAVDATRHAASCFHIPQSVPPHADVLLRAEFFCQRIFGQSPARAASIGCGNADLPFRTLLPRSEPLSVRLEQSCLAVQRLVGERKNTHSVSDCPSRWGCA